MSKSKKTGKIYFTDPEDNFKKHIFSKSKINKEGHFKCSCGESHQIIGRVDTSATSVNEVVMTLSVCIREYTAQDVHEDSKPSNDYVAKSDCGTPI